MKTKLAARGIIMHEGKIFLVKHHGSDFYALPGGKLDDDEPMQVALKRELVEELGVEAQVGKLLYINEFRYEGGSYSLEFFYLIDNPADFLEVSGGTLAEAELEEHGWFDSLQTVSFKPDFFAAEYKDLQKEIPKHVSYFCDASAQA